MTIAIDPRTTHLGVLYDDVDDLVETVAPRLDHALGHGSAVTTLVDRRTARGLRDALGDRGSALTFASPHVGTARAEDLLRGLRRTVTDAAGRGALVLTQYSAFATPAAELAVSEAGINLVLGDLPFTMLCACARGDAPDRVETLRRGHPGWVDGAETADNPAFRPPEDRSPTPSTVWGGLHVLRLHFGQSVDLQRVRTHVAALAAEVGLRGEAAQTAVFAVHEAAVVACDEVEDARALAPASAVPAVTPSATPAAVRGRPGPADPCVLDVWTAGPRLVAEVHGPRAGTSRGPDAPAADGLDPRLPRNRLRMAGPLRLVRAFCRDVTSRETPTSRTIRVVT